MSATTGPDAANPRDLREYDGSTVYVVHLDPPYRHARHYTGNPGSSAFLKVACGVHGRGLAELTGSAWVVGRSASGEGWQQVRVSQRWAVAGSGRGEAGAVQFLLDEPQRSGEVLRAALGGPAEDAQAVFELVEGEPVGCARIQVAALVAKEPQMGHEAQHELAVEPLSEREDGAQPEVGQ